MAICSGIDIKLSGAGGRQVRALDREVILARADIEIDHVQVGNFAASSTLSLGGAQDAPIPLLRGWASVHATLEGRTFCFVSTHLEMARFPHVQNAQADELVRLLEAEPLPVILVGDFNSAADGSKSASCGKFIGAGFADAWKETNALEAGFTCCHDNDLLNPASGLSERIDLIFFGGGFAAANARVVGDDPAARTPSGLWPSDHAGVVATLYLPGRKGTVCD